MTTNGSAISIDDALVLSEIISFIPYSIFWKDNRLVFQGCNLQFAQQFGYNDVKDIIGKTDNDFPWSKNDLKEKYNADDLYVIDTGNSLINIEEEQIQMNGSVETLLVSKVPLKNRSGHIIGILGTYNNITYLKNIEKSLRSEKEKSEAANRAKTEFLANMSHDVKSPMSGIVTFTQLMMSNPAWRTPEKAEQVHASAEQVLKFFDSCLELSKLEMSEFESQKIIFSLPELLEEIHALFVPRAQSKGLGFTVDYDASLPKIFLGHRGSLYRVVLNLVGNAVKFTENGEVSLRAFVAGFSDNKIRVGIEVKDTGPGIPEDKHQVIFEKLQRLTTSYEGKVEGSGIGLYIVDQYVKHMQGEINVKSHLGQGSTFTLLLPMVVASESDLPEEQRLKENTSTPVTPITKPVVAKFISVEETTLSADAPLVLLVEDNPMIQIATEGLLNSAGFRVNIAGTGAEALESFVPGKYALIYMDIGLPDMQGYDVAAAIRKKENELNAVTEIPIVALTGHGAVDVQTFCGHSGMQGILSKPITPEKIRGVWQRYGKGEMIDVPGMTPLDAALNTKHTAEERIKTMPIIDLTETIALMGSEIQANKTFELLAKDLRNNYLPQLKKTVQQQDYIELRKHLHSLIGALCYAKAPRLHHASLELQEAAFNTSPTIVVTAYQHVRAEAEQFLEHYPKFSS